jgi:peptide methionine sulfoxide reductase MsrB
MYIVFRCRKCGRYLYSSTDKKTRKCTCYYTNKIERVRVVARTDDERIAAEIVRQKQGSGTGFRALG